MRLVIVGSVAADWTADEAVEVKALIRRVIRERGLAAGGKLIVGSGRSPKGGVDIWAEEIAGEMGVPFMAFPPDRCESCPARHCVQPFEHMYRPRNERMADWGDALVRIRSARSRTYGSGWTRDHAARKRKPTEEHVPNAPRPSDFQMPLEVP